MTLTRRSLICSSAGAAMLAGTRGAQSKERPILVLTGDMGMVGQRLLPLLTEFTIRGIDIKRGFGEDLASPGPWLTRLEGADAVLHLAWDVPNYNSVHGAMYNSWITQAAFAAAVRADVPRFIFASSAWVAPQLYGGRLGRVIPEIYAESKRVIEGWMDTYGLECGMATRSIRFGQVNPKREDQMLDPDFDGRVLMTDADLFGLVNLGLQTGENYNPIGPFDARKGGGR